MTTWVDVSDAATTWTAQEGYVHNRYVVDGYVIGYEPTADTWTAVPAVSTTWAGV